MVRLPRMTRGIKILREDRNTYQIKVNNKWDDVEFINEKWYWIYWSAPNGTCSVSQNDRISFPGNYTLRTKSKPYISVEDQSHLNLDETFGSDTTHDKGSSLLHKEGISLEDQPTVD